MPHLWQYSSALTFFFVGIFGWLETIGQTSEIAGFGFSTPDVQVVQIPVEIEHNLVLLPIRINGSMPLHFILDSGTKTTILAEPMLAPMLGLSNFRPVAIRGWGENGTIPANISDKVNFRLTNDVLGKNLSLVVLPEGVLSLSALFGKPVYGIIGEDLLKSFVVEINYTEKYIKLYDKAKYKPPRRATAIPIRLENGRPYCQAAFSDSSQNHRQLKMLLDTGASYALSLHYNGVKVPAKNLPTFLGTGMSGNVYGLIGKIPIFHWADFAFNEVVTGFPADTMLRKDLVNQKWDGNIGGEILKRFTLTFDYIDSTVYLKKNAFYKKRFSYNTTGIELTTAGNDYTTYIISYVRPQSAAEQAGILVGDVVTKINGNVATAHTLSEWYALLHNKRAGSKICLHLLRAGQPLRVCFTSRESL